MAEFPSSLGRFTGRALADQQIRQPEGAWTEDVYLRYESGTGHLIEFRYSPGRKFLSGDPIHET
ncbi:MAG: hypothetical protein AAGC55_00580, partial [Myxococcota bacterium]